VKIIKCELCDTNCEETPFMDGNKVRKFIGGDIGAKYLCPRCANKEFGLGEKIVTTIEGIEWEGIVFYEDNHILGDLLYLYPVLKPSEICIAKMTMSGLPTIEVFDMLLKQMTSIKLKNFIEEAKKEKRLHLVK